MKLKFTSLVLAALVLAAPAVADARPDRGGGDGGRAAREEGYRERDRDGGPRAEGPGRGQGRGDGRGDEARPRRELENSLGAGWRQQQDQARRGVRQGRYVPLARVLGDISRRTPGRQLDAGIEESYQGRTVYRVRWAARNGRRIDYIVDAQTGQVLSAEGQ